MLWDYSAGVVVGDPCNGKTHTVNESDIIRLPVRVSLHAADALTEVFLDTLTKCEVTEERCYQI